MHFSVVWKLPDRRNDSLVLDLIGCFSGFKFAKVLEYMYIVGVSTSDEYEEITEKLLDVARANTDIELVISPPVPPGRYIGWRPKEVWAEANRVSEEP